MCVLVCKCFIGYSNTTINAQSNVQANQQTIFEFLSIYSKATKVNLSDFNANQIS
jgi:hypothetical protein